MPPSPSYQLPEVSYGYNYGGSISHYTPQEHHYPQTIYGGDSGIYPGGAVADPASSGQWAFAAPAVPSIEYSIPSSPRTMYHHHQPMPYSPRKPLHTLQQRQNQRVESAYLDADYSPYSQAPTTGGSGPYSASAAMSDGLGGMDSPGHAGSSAVGQISEKNQLNVEAIEQGKDMRTTVMIKNIPNKMSDKDLLTFIGKVCPRRIDFLYLRMDFQNGEFVCACACSTAVGVRGWVLIDYCARLQCWLCFCQLHHRRRLVAFREDAAWC